MDAEVAEERGQFRNEKTPHSRVHENPNFFIISVGIFFCANKMLLFSDGKLKA